MAVFSGPKSANTNNLSASLDLANAKNYSGSGTSISSVISGPIFTLSNVDTYYKVYDFEVADYGLPNSAPPPLPVYSTASGGTITFDGVNNCLRFSNLSLINPILTVEMWAKFSSGYANNILFGFDRYKISTESSGLGFSTTNNDIIGITSATLATIGVENTWNHYVFEMRSDVSYTNNKIYINGVSRSLTATGTELAANRVFNTYGSIASWVTAVGYETPMSLSSLRLYNRSLTQDEVLSNYYASRSRFI